MQLMYRWYCEQRLPLDIKETAIEKVATDLGLSKEATTVALRDMTNSGLFNHGQDYDVSRTLLDTYERQFPDDEVVKLNLQIRSLINDKVVAARHADEHIISHDEIYNDPDFSKFKRNEIFRNIEYLSLSNNGVTINGTDGFSIVV